MKYPDKQLGLWSHQVEAVGKVEAYFDRRASQKRQEHPAALVNIPTGGGKTSVIATLAHWHPATPRVLVLAPRTAIRAQLAKELSARRGHLRRCGFTPDNLPKRVVELKGSKDIPDDLPESIILVSTIQLLNDLHGSAEFEKLANLCTATFVDEGHYEPAAAWSVTLRALKRPLVLVTATPYRNDWKTFKVDSGGIHVSKYSELKGRRILREVRTVGIDPNAIANETSFVEAVVAEFEKAYGHLPNATHKLIIRCGDAQQIEQIGNAILSCARLAPGGVMCLHERFAGGKVEDWKRKQPPDPELANSAAIWVHQHKLLEGVDGPSFRAVAFYGVVGSDRALVQQIGRVIRNPGLEEDSFALLIDHTGGGIKRSWEMYLDYDRLLSPITILQGIQETYAQLEASTPPVQYIAKNFRRRLQLHTTAETDIRRSLRLPMRCLVLRRGRATMEDACKGQVARFQEQGWPSRLVSQSDDELIILYTVVGVSPLLREHVFLQPELQCVIVRKLGDLLIYLDTGHPGIDDLTANKIDGRVPRSALERTLTRSESLRVVAIDATNAALGPNAIRRRSVAAASLEGTPPTLDEFQFVASTVRMAGRPAFLAQAPDAEPRPDQFQRREVGFSRSRITDAGARRSLDGWTAWTNAIAAAIDDQAIAGLEYLDRFATPMATAPADPAPLTVLIDLEGLEYQYLTAQNAFQVAPDQALDFEDVLLSCIVDPVDPTLRHFTLTANGVSFPGTVRYDAADKVYQLTIPHLAALYRPAEGPHHYDIVGDLNARQAFSIVPETPGVIYVGGDFYDPKLRLGANFNPKNLGLNSLLEAHPALRLCKSEKGKGPGPDGWEATSVFEWIDSNIDQILPGADLVICDDGSRETCDFLLCGTRAGRDVVVLVHAKASSDGSFVSAGALSEVCGQAAKQVGALSLFAPLRPKAYADWTGPWSDSVGKAGDVTQRIRVKKNTYAGCATADEIWGAIDERLRRHDTEREVVLVLGATLDPKMLFGQAGQVPPTANAVHAIHLLRSTLAAAVGAGARLRVICG